MHTVLSFLLLFAATQVFASTTDVQLLQSSLRRDMIGVTAALRAGANSNFADQGYTPLMAASNNGFIDIANALISAGANVNAFKNGVCGYSAIWLAAYTGRDQIVALLASKGAEKNKPGGCFSETPLRIAERYGRHSTVRILQSLGGY
jgi:ankyrin repeat protein